MLHRITTVIESTMERWRGRWASALYGIEVGEDCRIGRGARFSGYVRGIRLGRQVTIRSGARLYCIDEYSSIEIGDKSIIHEGVVIDSGPGGRVCLGRLNSLNPYCVVYGHGGLVTGSMVRVAAHAVLIPANHVFDDPDQPIANQGLERKGIAIEDDVWIGAGVRILDGVRVGRGCVIAAGSVVHRNLEPFTIAAGVPARALRSRRAGLEDPGRRESIC
jgi:acetyltransferase-like isoleucine patch superfamily enzyme